jgi:acyl-CoA hydrolase
MDWSTSRESRSPNGRKAMISIAHPDFREDLEREARTNGLIPRIVRVTSGPAAEVTRSCDTRA